MSQGREPLPEGAETAVRTKRVVSVNLEAQCRDCGHISPEGIVYIGGEAFCGRCLANFLIRFAIPRVTMVRTERFVEDEHAVLCEYCGKPRPATRESCPHCGRQPED